VVLPISSPRSRHITAIDLAGRVSEYREEPRRATAWLAGGAFAMGAGIWSMHFVAMLAYKLPIPVRYEPWTTLASMVAAIATSGFALYIVTRGASPGAAARRAATIMGAASARCTTPAWRRCARRAGDVLPGRGGCCRS
jgi:NO-binding membrane sensor protein with MHYT domain